MEELEVALVIGEVKVAPVGLGFFFLIKSGLIFGLGLRNGSVKPWVFCLGVIYNLKIICHIILKHVISFFG